MAVICFSKKCKESDRHRALTRHTLFYCDPPYWGTEGYGVEFGIDQYDEMAELARSIKGKMVISVNDIPEMRRAFDGLEMETVKINYTVGGQNGRGERSELLIRNWS